VPAPSVRRCVTVHDAATGVCWAWGTGLSPPTSYVVRPCFPGATLGALAPEMIRTPSNDLACGALPLGPQPGF